MGQQVPDEMLMAYADGELAPEKVEALEAMLRQNATLRARLAPFVITRGGLAEVFEHRLHEPIPERLIAAIADSALPAANRAKPARAPAESWIGGALRAAASTLFPQGLPLATAASIALLVSAGTLGGWLAGQQTAPAVASHGLIDAAGPGLLATGALAQTLETEPSRPLSEAFAGGATLAPVASFRTAANSVCREYRVQGPSGGSDFAGIACRAPEGLWRVALHVETPKLEPDTGEVPKTTYQTAAGAGGAAAVEALVDGLMAGDVLGPDDEAVLLKQGWK